jgi:hypothetical protein
MTKTIKELIKALEYIDNKNSKFYVSSDEELNTIFTDFRILHDKEDNSYIIFGLSGSEINDY